MNELVQQLVSTLGVKDEQAKGGAGLLLKLARQKLGGDFAQVAAAVPGAEELIGAAPAPGGASTLLGGLAGAVGAGRLGDLASLAGGFSQLGLDKGLAAKFVPVLLEFVSGKGGPAVKALLAGVLT